MEETIKVITLEDGIKYNVIDEITSKENKYAFLSNEMDPDDFCIRKVIMQDNEEVLIGLDDDAEFDLALMLFAKKHPEELEEINK